ncbi:BspA family leucine-rich repeat surface protein [Runella limosa]|uniref:BspA family leucine-rich repeat surface protein n=1 Tax=Runella limosa TaxID=370978 RepID=UPI000405B337|nr:BspA family leucine-rich repeat surface protein [Runella limosa]
MQKILLQFLTIFSFAWATLLHSAQAQSSPFITRWDLSKPGDAATTLTFGVATAGTVSYTWQQVSGTASGSGTFSGSTLTITNLPANAIIDLSIDPVNFQRININYGTNRQRLTEIKQWGTVAWSSMERAFEGCSNMALTATDVPNFAAVTNMSYMFASCSTFNQSVSNFNTAAVTDMSDMFAFCRAFNQSVSNFNTDKVTSMNSMFHGCNNFNQSVSNFNTDKVTDMSNMFFDCNVFNQSVSNFNTEKTANMSYMFYGCKTFNQSVSNFNTAKVTNMNYMFGGCSTFNQSVSNFNTEKVTDMSEMFSGCRTFNQSVSNFNTEKVTGMSGMFYGCRTFNQPVSNFNTEKVTNMSNMFYGCSIFNQPVSNFNTTAVTDMSWMFFGCSAFNHSMSNFNTAAVTDMSLMFAGCSIFNQSVSNFNTENVTYMFNMFAGCSAFNQNLASWGSKLHPNVNLTSFLDNCGMSVANYDATLTAFAVGSSVTGRTMGASNLNYCNAETARTLLTTPVVSGGKGWSISGDSKNCTIPTVITIAPERPAICPGTSITLTASGCAGTIIWRGGESPQTGASITVSPALTTSYSANCSTSGTETVTVKVANSTLAVGYNVVTEKERFKALTSLSSDKKVGNVNFTPSAHVSFEAGNSITLLPGFSAEKTSTFLAEIKGCQ